jgi:hypothetical protein
MFNLTLGGTPGVDKDVPWYAVHFPAAYIKDSVVEDKPK